MKKRGNACKSDSAREEKAKQRIEIGLGDINFFVYHDTLGGYHDIPDIMVEFKLLEIKVTLKLN